MWGLSPVQLGVIFQRPNFSCHDNSGPHFCLQVHVRNGVYLVPLACEDETLTGSYHLGPMIWGLSLNAVSYRTFTDSIQIDNQT